MVPNLLDVDGDACHHLHNASRKFTKIFDNYLEVLFRDIHNDFKWSENLGVILENLGVTYCQPQMYASTRWLSIYEITISTIYMFDVFVVFYLAFLSTEDHSLFKSKLDAIYSLRKVPNETKKTIQKHQTFLTKKKLTESGKDCKKRI